MNFRILKSALVGLALSFCGFANAGLIMNVTDNGFGVAQFTLSGTDIIASGSEDSNGMWLDNDFDPILSSLFNNNQGVGAFSLTSGIGLRFLLKIVTFEALTVSASVFVTKTFPSIPIKSPISTSLNRA